MKGRVRALFVVGVIITASLASSAPVAANACGGSTPGVRVHENINYGGRSALACGVGWARNYFPNWTDNLGFFESWNDRISSYYTFSFNGHEVNFWFAAYYGGGAPVWTKDTDGIPDLRGYVANDVFSSGKIIY